MKARFLDPIALEVKCQQDKVGKVDDQGNPVNLTYSYIKGHVNPANNIATIDEMFTDKKLRRIGIGRQLVESFIALAKVNCPLVNIVVVDTLPEAKLFYMKLGFKISMMKSKTITMQKVISGKVVS